MLPGIFSFWWREVASATQEGGYTLEKAVDSRQLLLLGVSLESVEVDFLEVPRTLF
jgi:hypothetical protein